MEEHQCQFCCVDTYLAVHAIVNGKAEEDGSHHTCGSSSKSLRMNPVAGNSADNDILDSAALTASSLQACMDIAENNPESPVTAIADAAFRSDERVMGGNSVVAFTPHVAERFGNVISILTFANSNIVQTEEGLVMIDCGTVMAAGRIYDTVREMTQAPLHTAIYTHGHVDHIMLQHTGFEEEALERGYPRTRVIAHENVPVRFDRYKATRGYNTVINQRQFQLPKTFTWPKDYRYPDETYCKFKRIEVGSTMFELHHHKGETDDATIVWMPKEKYVFTGDFFIWNVPNCGNPQKVQRYPLEWVAALRQVYEWEPEILFPGHGPPIIGADRVRQALQDTIQVLEEICVSTMQMINQGKDLTFIMNNVQFNTSLLERPYLYPKYDDPRFIAASLFRRYCGWYTFELTRLLPVPKAEVGKQIAALAGSPLALAQRAEFVASGEGDHDLGTAIELVEYAAAALEDVEAKEVRQVHEIRARILRKKQFTETCLMAQSIFKASAIDSEKLVKDADKPANL